MKVTVNIDDREFWKLANRAEREGVKVADLISAIFRTAQDVKALRPIVFRDKVAELVDRGIPDPVIAHRLGEPLQAVRVARRSLKLPAVKFKRERWQHELGRATVRPSALEGP